MKDKVLKLFIERGFLLDSDMLNFLNELKDENVANEIIDKIAITSQQKVITKGLVDKNIEKIDGLSKSNTGQQTLKCIKKSDIIVLNNSSLKALKEKISKVLLDLLMRETDRLKNRLLEATLKVER